ncbi:two-component regulator propeller domain-containing protein [Colwellia psychrerythraea]|uniref:two-component regulator propeller domain-containing protein n=1 Tax=Colwellia psychrerythraea TaxID=28229 RepID=UPI000519FA7E|nr:two-component regulator propeller domain-containing protein [Colwellia psychrerythraea]
MKQKLLLLFFIIFNFNAIAQEVKRFKNFGLDNPMSYNFVRTIAQDQDGFMWFGSSEGLDRFDGHQSLSFHHDAALPNSLSSNVISRILIDKKQRLWVGTFGGGLNLFRAGSQDFIHFTTNTKQASLSNDTVNALFEDSEGKIWIGTENGLNIISTKDKQWSIKQIHQELGNPDSLSHNTVHSIIETKSQHIWVGTNGGGISVFDLSGKFIKLIKFGDSNAANYINKFINSLYRDVNENIWIGTIDNGLIKYDPSSAEFSHYLFKSDVPSTISSNSISKIYQDSANNIWVATDNGLSIYNDTTNDFSRYNHSISNPYSLSNDYILTFFEDKNNMMWVGTFTGVNRWDPNMATFRQYNSHTNPTLRNNNITSFTQFDEKSIIFSTYTGGIYQLTTADKQISQMEFKHFFAELRIMSLLSDGDILWVGTRASGLYAVNMISHEITRYQHDINNDKSISANSVTDIIKDHSGTIWVATFHQGLNRLNKDGTFKRFVKNKLNTDKGPSSNNILQLLQDDQGFIWLATFGGGLSRFEPKIETFSHFLHDDKNANSLSDDFTWIMLLDNQQNLWVGTQAAGLNILTRENRYNNNFSFRHLSSKDGMKSKTIYGIVQDLYDDIWLSTSKGISRYSTHEKSFKHFNLTHGLVDLEYTHSAIFQALDNTLYFGAGKGMNSINPGKINTRISAPEVRLTNVLKMNEPMALGSSISKLRQLNFDYSDQLISFEYVGLNYTAPESTRYKYRLKGFDEEWIDAGKSRRATYTNLPSGSYQLQIIAANNDNFWSKSGLTLDITVQPAPWNTWWAYVLYAALIALLLLAYSRLLNRKLLIEQQQKENLKQQVKEKTQEFHLKNVELEQANLQLEDAATVDKVTGVKSRRYLDIYIEQASQLMSQIHENILPVQRSLLPRLSLVMIKLENIEQVTNSQLVNLTDILLYSRNSDDLVIRWTDDTFVIIGYEKDNNTRDLVTRLTSRFEQVLGHNIKTGMAYAFYPFNFEQPMALSWDQVSVLTEHALKIARNNQLDWLGFHAPKVQPFNYLDVIQQQDIGELSKLIKLKQG